MFKQGSPFYMIVGLLTLTGALTACGQQSSSGASVESDASASGAAAGAVGGALSSSNSGGTQASFKYQTKPSFVASLRSSLDPMPKAMADVLCPTFRSTDATCSTSGSSMWLSYDDCTFRGDGTWNGVQSITMSTGAAACGTFPNPGANGTLYRQFVSSAGSNSPSSLALSYANYSAAVDDSSANLANFDNQAIATIQNGGYGSAVQFNAQGARSQVTIGHHISVSGAYNHSVSGSLTGDRSGGRNVTHAQRFGEGLSQPPARCGHINFQQRHSQRHVLLAGIGKHHDRVRGRRKRVADT